MITRDMNTIQMDGEISELEGNDRIWAKDRLSKKHPGDAVFLNNPKGLFFRFKPNWIRFLNDDGSSMPKEIMVMK